MVDKFSQPIWYKWNFKKNLIESYVKFIFTLFSLLNLFLPHLTQFIFTSIIFSRNSTECS